jgi:hypothetical protein
MRYLLLCFFLALPYQARADRDGFHAYGAFGVNYSFSSARIGYKDWEIGQINRVVGFDKIFSFGSRYYSTIGLVYTGNLGLYSGMGLKFDLWFIPIRCELAAYMDAKASTQANALIGVTYGF